MSDLCIRAKRCENNEIKFRLYDWDTEGYFTEEMTREQLRLYLMEKVDAVIERAAISGTAYFSEPEPEPENEGENTLDDPWE